MKKGELESWEVRKKSILTKYSTSETLTMANYFSLQDKGKYKIFKFEINLYKKFFYT